MLNLSPQETALFLHIHCHLPAEEQSRYDTLRAKREAEVLTSAEHAELFHYVETLETLWADRLHALIELAQLRHISPEKLMQQLDMAPNT